MAGETVITVVGNLVDDPELRFTPSGAAVAKFRVASTPRTFDRQTNEWKDGESLFLTCSVWRQAAENVAESLQRGMRVIVQGRLKQRSYEDREDVLRVGGGAEHLVGDGEEQVAVGDEGLRGAVPFAAAVLAGHQLLPFVRFRRCLVHGTPAAGVL